MTQFLAFFFSNFPLNFALDAFNLFGFFIIFEKCAF